MPTDLVKVKVQGARLLTPLQAEVQSLSVTTPEEYEAADEILRGIKKARAQWDAMIEPVLKPLREAKSNADKLKRDVDAPLAQLEEQVKGHMRHFKLEEQRQLAAAQRKVDEEQAKLAAEEEALAERELKARTSQMRERLAKQREVVAEKAAAIETPIETKGANSQARRVRTWKLVDQNAAMQAQIAGKIPEVFSLSASLMNQQLREHGLETICKWPGFEMEEDIIIAGRAK